MSYNSVFHKNRVERKNWLNTDVVPIPTPHINVSLIFFPRYFPTEEK